jgi:iron complex transport system substrate-binding protein
LTNSKFKPRIKSFVVSAAAVSATLVTVSGSSSASPSTAASAPAAYPARITNCGHTYSYTKAPTRVIIGYPTQIETLAALGAQGRVLGYLSGSLSPLPPGYKSIREISPQYTASREVILGADPDMIILDGSSQDNGTQGTPTNADLVEAGVNPYIMQGNCAVQHGTSTIQGIYTDLTDLGEIFGAQSRAATLVAKLKTEVRSAAALRGDRPKATVAFIQIYDGKVYALSGGNYNVVLSSGGFINEFAKQTAEFEQISPEKVLTLNADWIFASYSPPDTPATTLKEVKSTLGSNSAVRQGHIVTLSGNGTEVGGIPLFDLVIQAADAVYGNGGDHPAAG